MSTSTGERDTTRRTKRAPKAATAKEPKAPKASSPATKARRSPMLISLGVALALVGGLATAWVVGNAGQTVQVYTTSTNVQRGQAITADDITSVSLAAGQNVDAYPANKPEAVIGQIATVDLPKGSLVTPRTVGKTIGLEKGQSVVGVAVTVAQIPSTPLVAGDKVRVVETPVSQGEPPAAAPVSFQATVFTTHMDPTAEVQIVDLIVPETVAADIAARAATGRIAIVLDSTGE